MGMELEKRYSLSEGEYCLLLGQFQWSQPERVCDLTLGMSGPTSMQTHGWVVRLRCTDADTKMEYKAPINPEWTAWSEFSTTVGSFGQCVSILQAIGLKPGLLLDRTRRMAREDGVTLSLDDVKGLGYFVEVEVEAAEASDARALRLIGSMCERLRLAGKPEAKPYGEILLGRMASDSQLQLRHEALVRRIIEETADE